MKTDPKKLNPMERRNICFTQRPPEVFLKFKRFAIFGVKDTVNTALTVV